MWQAGEHGLQRARKGVRFVEFPGVLQVTLWRGVDKTWVALPPKHILMAILFNNNTPLRIKIVLSGSTGVSCAVDRSQR